MARDVVCGRERTKARSMMLGALATLVVVAPATGWGGERPVGSVPRRDNGAMAGTVIGGSDTSREGHT
jgi:hypothetical protein